jgi:hypothetical protein
MQGFGAINRRVWDANEEKGVSGKVQQGTPKPCTFYVQLRDLAHAYVCENHETLSPWQK